MDDSNRSLENMHNSVPVPGQQAGFWRRWRAFVGPALLVSIGYMDPGNWSTDLAAGAQFKYGLLWVVALASVMAMFMQIIAARLGVATGKDLAQACRDWYPKWTRWPNWLLCELAIGSTDLAEALGGGRRICGDDYSLLRHRDFYLTANAAEFCGNGARFVSTKPASPRHVGAGHRNHRCDDYAA